MVLNVVSVNFLKKKVYWMSKILKKPFWGNSCPVKSCCENKGLTCCGKCKEFPCDLLTSFAYDGEQGDNGLRIENCKTWCDLK